MFTNHSRTKGRSQCVKRAKKQRACVEKHFNLSPQKFRPVLLWSGKASHDQTSKLARSNTRLTVGDMVAHRIDDDEILTVTQGGAL